MRKVVLVLAVMTGALIAQVLLERLRAGQALGPSALLALAVLGAVFALLVVTWVLHPTAHRRTMANIWLTGTSIVVTYLLLDVVIGLALIKPLSPPLVPDEYRHHKMVPNSQALLEQQDFRYIQHVNSLGIRGREVAVDRAPGTYRILMLGDSFTMGKGVEDEQTFSVVLEAALNQAAACRDGRSVEIVNGGTDSYAPILSYIELKRELHVLKPDLVVLNFDNSDLLQDLAYRKTAVIAPDGDVVAVPQRAPSPTLSRRIQTWAEHHLFFTRALMYYVNQSFGFRTLTVQEVVTQANMETLGHTLADDTNPRREEWQSVFQSLERIKAYTDSQGIDFALSVYPWAHQVSETEWVPGRLAFMAANARPTDRSVGILRSFASDHGIDFIDAFPTFRAQRGREPLYFKHDMHWTPAGHRLMATALERHLVEHYPEASCR